MSNVHACKLQSQHAAGYEPRPMLSYPVRPQPLLLLLFYLWLLQDVQHSLRWVKSQQAGAFPPFFAGDICAGTILGCKVKLPQNPLIMVAFLTTNSASLPLFARRLLSAKPSSCMFTLVLSVCF